MTRRTCQLCLNDYRTHLGDGTYGAFSRKGFDAHYAAIQQRKASTGRDYKLNKSGALTPGVFDMLIDKERGDVCRECLTPFS